MKPTNDKQARALTHVKRYAAAGIVIAAVDILPGTVTATLSTMEIAMCWQVGKIYRGEDYTLREATKDARTVGLVAIAAKVVAMETCNFVPIAGWLVKAAIAGGVIKQLGEAIIKHYENLERRPEGATPIEAEIVSEPAGKNRPRVLLPSAESKGTIAARLKLLTGLLAKKLISDEEYRLQRQQILNGQ